MSRISLPDFFRYYSNTKEQQEAVVFLESVMPVSLLEDDSHWVELFRQHPAISNPLRVEYFWQRDNYDGYGDRECQTSSIAMALHFLEVDGINTDDDYLHLVNRVGDTTEQNTHALVLSGLGVQARFATNLHKEDIIKQIDDGAPMPCGILHHGFADAPSGGGHWMCAIGYTDTHVICHDPYGELNMSNGKWCCTGEQDGKAVHYSWGNFLKRWDVNGGGGWGWLF